DEIRRLRFIRAEGSGEELHAARQEALILRGQLGQILGWTQDEQVDRSEAVAPLGRKLPHHLVHSLHAHDVFVDDVEEDRIYQLADDLCGRWVAFDLRHARFIRCALVTGGHRQDALRAEMHGRGERSGEADATVAVPAVLDAHSGKDERYRRRGEDVLHGQFRRSGATIRSFEYVESASLDPPHALSGGVIQCDERDGSQFSALQVAPDAVDRHVAYRGVEQLSQQRGERAGVEESVRETPPALRKDSLQSRTEWKQG